MKQQKSNNSNDWSIFLVDRFEKIRSLIKNIKVAQYNKKGVNIGYKEGVDVVLDFISSELQQEREKVLEEVREIIKNKSGIPIFFKKEDDMSENNPHFKAICYYLNQLRQELLSEINNLKNNDSNKTGK